MGHQLIALLGGGIERHRIIHPILNCKRNLLVSTVNARRRSVHQVLYRMVPAGLEDIVKANYIAFNINIRILNRVPHPGLSREVNHNVEFLLFEKTAYKLTVSDGALNEAVLRVGSPRRGGNLPKPILLQAHIVVTIQIIQPYNPARTPLEALLQEPHHQIRPDKPGAAGHKYLLHNVNF